MNDLESFVRNVKSGRADFTQVVTAPDGAKKKTSSGEFEFQRPNRFRFDYTKPYEAAFLEDMATLRLQRPEMIVRATDHIGVFIVHCERVKLCISSR